MSASQFRRAALALPGAVEGAHQRTADFRVGKRIFATLGYPDDAWGMVKLTQEQQSMLVDADPEIFRPVPPDIRAWFKSVIAPNGVPCCDESDGHRTTYDVRGGAYWVPIEGQWMQVPERAVIRDRGNPIGEAVVWYVHHRGSIIISCFVPADAV